tara:strand:- start:106 stop:354 length:249 start_codon:yes stop_codon:yes gene_type:complete
MANVMELKEYDKVVRRFVTDYVNNLTPDQMRDMLIEQSHNDLENIRLDTGQIDVFEEMAGWDSEVAESVFNEFNITIEDYYE